ncbi:MAG: hypothetical protein LBN33_11355 [Desulfovibrio sp.]|nr:hypothetical protein [Desulfovibrio sp.]
MSACQSHQTLKDSWKFTRRQYTNYLNTPATVDLKDKGNRENYEMALGQVVMNLDSELSRLIRAVENTEHNPDANWALSMMQKFPWISGVALVGSDGTVNSRYPEYFAKAFDASPLLEPDPKQRMGMLRAYVQTGGSSPEIYIGNPVYFGEDLLGIIVAHFDPATLATMSPDPGSFIMLTPEALVWPGRFGGGIGAEEKWKDILASASTGTMGSGDSAFFWTTRYIGNLPLIYAIPVNSVPQNEEVVAPVETRQSKDSGDDKQQSGKIIAPENSSSDASANLTRAVEQEALIDVPGAQH